MKCIAIDDEPLALYLIQNYAKQIEWLDVCATFTNGLDAKKYLENNAVDLLFLDIQMPDMDGLHLLNNLEEKPSVIFTTAYSQYAVEGFNLDAIDYLLKPFDFDRFLKAVIKAKEWMEYKQNKTADAGYLFIKYNYHWNKVFFKDITLIEALDDYIKIYIDPKPLLVHMSMKTAVERLPTDKFLRVHRSYIVAIEKILSWNKNSLRILDKTIPISYTYQKQVIEELEKRMKESL
ncbi:MAG: LytTR family DNA-binding domain-containing protein [Chitinophagaceae bacterium]|jgi:DNA-binding LytR/AlgR family response regulator|nr:LytTR family DNA-binding domain-containing protein [Chitinophagaceae bacterium]